MLAQDDMNWFIGTIVPRNHLHLLGGVMTLPYIGCVQNAKTPQLCDRAVEFFDEKTVWISTVGEGLVPSWRKSR